MYSFQFLKKLLKRTWFWGQGIRVTRVENWLKVAKNPGQTSSIHCHPGKFASHSRQHFCKKVSIAENPASFSSILCHQLGTIQFRLKLTRFLKQGKVGSCLVTQKKWPKNLSLINRQFTRLNIYLPEAVERAARVQFGPKERILAGGINVQSQNRLVLVGHCRPHFDSVFFPTKSSNDIFNGRSFPGSTTGRDLKFQRRIFLLKLECLVALCHALLHSQLGVKPAKCFLEKTRIWKST